jgi:putative phosphoribosyl transferase
VCIRIPASFVAVGQWYEDFAQTSDKEVHNLLALAAERS